METGSGDQDSTSSMTSRLRFPPTSAAIRKWKKSNSPASWMVPGSAGSSPASWRPNFVRKSSLEVSGWSTNLSHRSATTRGDQMAGRA